MSTSRIAYLDCSTGVSGDKLLGALLDAGTKSGGFLVDDVRSAVGELVSEARMVIDPVTTHGIRAASVQVSTEQEPPCRTWLHIRTLIEKAPLADAVRECALRAFSALAEAEASVHSVPVDDVHFHEVGAADSIVDVIGVCLGMHALGITELSAGPVAVGVGTVDGSHGVLPVPAPATAELLREVPITPGPAPGELTTPTGAALLRALGCRFGSLPQMRIEQIGYGAGSRDIGMPNVCRLLIGESTDDLPSAPSGSLESVVLLETNIDHISAEELAFAAAALLGAGALDVWRTPIVMKKGRAAVTLSVLATPHSADALTTRVISLTGSLGVRRSFIERSCEPRESRKITTPWGSVRLKAGAGRLRPEHDDVARIARERSLPYSAVEREIALIAEKPDAADER